jgi:hypothetical protein
MTTLAATLFAVLLAVPATAQEQRQAPEVAPPKQEAPAPDPEPEPELAEEEEPFRPLRNLPIEFRHHFLLRHATDKAEHYRATYISRIANEKYQGILLVNDLQHGKLILEHLSTFDDHKVTYSISDVKREDVVSLSFKTPDTAKTFDEWRREHRVHPELKNTAVLLTITTNGGEWTTSESEWKEWGRARELRYAIRRTLSPFLLEAIERMRGTIFASDDGRPYFEIIGRFLVYEDKDEEPPALEEVTLDAACDFDESFGYPCSTEQLKRIKDRAAAGKPLVHY